jgi:N-acetylneuraminate synthase
MSCIIVAEIGINHNGDLDIAKKMIAEAKQAGCSVVKFQKRTVDRVYTPEQLDKPRESPWGTTTRQQKEGLEFGESDYRQIDAYCNYKITRWFASPWDVDSVAFLAHLDPPFARTASAIKIPSALITDFELLAAIRQSDIPVIMSTGMSTAEEIDKAVDFFGDQLEYILACTSTYPTRAEEMNLRYIETLKKQYPHKRIGFSNHSPGIIFCLAAAALGAEMIEFHLTLDRAMYGSDQAASIEPTGARRLVRDVRAIEAAMGDGACRVWPSEEAIKEKLRK